MIDTIKRLFYNKKQILILVAIIIIFITIFAMYSPLDSTNDQEFYKGITIGPQNNKPAAKFQRCHSIGIQRNIQHFLLAKSDTDDVLRTEPPLFLSDVKNPCFAIAAGYINIGNITLAEALDRKYEIRCLPYAYQIGFTKAGSTDIFQKTTLHQNIYGSCHQRDGSPAKSCSTKEVHFWDNMFCEENNTFDLFTQGFQLYDGEGRRNEHFSKLTLDEVRTKMLFYEGTPRTVWHGDDWEKYDSNQGVDVPKVLIPNIIHHVNPNTKFVIVVRNPIARLKSDYKFFYQAQEKNGSDFHVKVVKAIEWWNKCTALYPVKRCAYGKAPKGLGTLDFEYCLEDRSFCRSAKAETGHICHHLLSWNINTTSADKLRISLYGLYIENWLNVFPKKSIKIITLEEYSKDPEETIEREILPFLGLNSFSRKTQKNLQMSLQKIVHLTKDFTLLPETQSILEDFFNRWGPYDSVQQLIRSK